MSEYLTARQLVAELSERGIGDWGPDIVRRWISEEPPLPVAQRGRPGQAHRYDADAVARWLRDRDARMGVTNDEMPADAAVEPEAANATEPVADATAVSEPSPAVAPAPVDASDPASVRDLLARATDEARYNPTVEAVLDVLRGRDPRNWKAAEDAYATRLKRLEAIGYLVSIDDMTASLDSQLAIFMTAVKTLRSQAKRAVAELDDPGLRETAIDDEFDQMLQSIADIGRHVERTGDAHAA